MGLGACAMLLSKPCGRLRAFAPCRRPEIFDQTTSMLRFPTNALASTLEDFTAEMRAEPAEAVRMPIKLELGGGFGSAVHAAQVLGTWARLNPEPKPIVISKSFVESDATRDRFASTLPGMAAIYFSQSLDCEGTSVSRAEALGSLAKRVAAMQQENFAETLRGVGTGLCCFGGARNEFLKPLYGLATQGGVRDEGGFRKLVPRLLGSLGGGVLERMTEGQLDYLSALVYQLFLNADEHGSDDVSGARYRRSLRGVTVRTTPLQGVADLIRELDDDVALKSFLIKRASVAHPNHSAEGRAAAKLATHGPTQFVELSVFDTGPGLGLRWLAKETGAKSYGDFSVEEEHEAVLTCFEKYATTKASITFGQGLTSAVMALEKLEAFMMLRTGRVSLYQDFSVDRGKKFAPRRRFLKPLPEVAGAAFTICFKVS